MIYVLSGTEKECEEWAKRHHLEKLQYKYILNRHTIACLCPESIHHRPGINQFIQVGTCRERIDYKILFDTLNSKVILDLTPTIPINLDVKWSEVGDPVQDIRDLLRKDGIIHG